MATVTGLTAERMLEIEAQSIVDGNVVGDNLILTRFDTTTIDAGSVRGPTGSPGITGGELADEIEDAFLLNAPVGSILEYIEPTVPNSLWIMMEGQTITNAQTTYPLLWAKIPASMKSGSSMIMPNTKGKVSVGRDPADPDFDTIGDTGGSKIPQLPTHIHTSPQHTHPQPAHAHDLQSHVHLAPSHSHNFNVNTSNEPNHAHRLTGDDNVVKRLTSYTPGASIALLDSNGDGIPDSGGTAGMAINPGAFWTELNGQHYHNVGGTTDVGNSVNWTGGPNTNTTGNGGNQDTNNNAAANTGPTGVTPSSAANVPPFIVFCKMIKAA